MFKLDPVPPVLLEKSQAIGKPSPSASAGRWKVTATEFAGDDSRSVSLLKFRYRRKDLLQRLYVPSLPVFWVVELPGFVGVGLDAWIMQRTRQPCVLYRFSVESLVSEKVWAIEMHAPEHALVASELSQRF